MRKGDIPSSRRALSLDILLKKLKEREGRE